MTDVLAAASGSTGGLGKIGTIPASGLLYVRCPVSERTERVKWRFQLTTAGQVQFFLADEEVYSVVLTLASLANGETLIVNGLTYTGHTDTTTVATRTFKIDGDDDADAVALAGVMNDPASGTLGIDAVASAGGIVTLTPKASGGATVIQAVTGTAGAHCAVSYAAMLLKLPRDPLAPLTGLAADTTTGGFNYDQYVDGMKPYARITNDNAASAMTAVVKARRFAAS